MFRVEAARRTAAAAAALLLTGCATGASVGSTAERLAELEQACRARGGVLVSSGGPPTGRPEVDNHCRIVGGATRLPGG
ncbi:hypothetical protein [Brevundimonas viscosa]|uniref:Secreted protein n=1 Tax=Brevundimonas viscosa TaxID=871741 RepID=A0A1I6NT69_9CAUL|nr:hypothetical protein [Brevundimonas viscosa]SFS31133.1 hypothetical protein SAMN05192570_0476 [Brevundimonas viscosa]